MSTFDISIQIPDNHLSQNIIHYTVYSDHIG